MPPNWLIAPKEAVLSWNFLTCFFLFLQSKSPHPTAPPARFSCCGKLLGTVKFPGVQSLVKSDHWVKSYERFPEMLCHKGMDWNNFLLLWLQINCDNSSSTRTFWTIQDGNFIYNVCSTSTALQICQKLNSWSSDSTDSLISSNSLLYTVWGVALWQLIMRLFPLAIHFW